MATLIVQTFWKRDELQCVLVRQRSGCLSVQVFIKDTAVVTEVCSLDDAGDVADQAARAFGIFWSAAAQRGCPPPRT